MKKIIMIMIGLMTSIAIGDSWYVVGTNTDGSASGVMYCETTKPHTLVDNEYPVTYTFPTNEYYKYWIKVDTNWVDMTTNQMAVVDQKIKLDVTTNAVNNINMDALFHLIAHMSTVKDKDYAYVTNAFMNSVSPSKDKSKTKN